MNIENDKLIQAIELQSQGKLEEASSLFRDILSADPNNAAALYSLALILMNAGNLAEALRLSGHGVHVSPGFAPIHFAHATVLQMCGQKEAALLSYDKALEIDPEYCEVLVNSGVLLRHMHRHHEALQRFNRVLNIDPNHLSALSNCAIILTDYKQSEKALEMFERLLMLKPDFNYALGNLCYERLHICDWQDYENVRQKIIEGIRQGLPLCGALALMSISDSASDHYLAAKIFAQHSLSTPKQPLWSGQHYRHDKLRIAYVSPDLREHPVGHLMAGVFENHDKSRVELIAISLGIDDHSRLRTRMMNAFDQFIDARLMGTQQIAQLMRDLEIDIAVDLGGYTSDTRSDIFTYRPAPVQVNFLGFPGTMGMACMDYIIADRNVIPEDQQQFYSEKVVYLPDCYLPTDSSLEISKNTPTRAECGLPENGFVFCSFSHDYKISPAMFDIWMRLLQQVPDSVLWLISRNELSQRNLRKEAALRGIDPDRLIFAQRVPLVEDHLARYRQADLFLDTHPYNAHTTAADALMAGLPVLTYMGNAFPSRVAGSLLHAIGVPELVTYSYADYETLALRLTREPATLADIRARIAQNKSATSVFDTKKFCEALENVFLELSDKPITAHHHDSAEHTIKQAVTLMSHDHQIAGAQPVMADNVLNTALDLFQQGNLPQAEFYLRQYLAHDAVNPTALSLLEKLRQGYGMDDGFELSEQTLAENDEPRYLLIKAWGYGFWSEVHHLASHLLVAELTGRKPIVIWGENCLFRREGDINAFTHFFHPVSSYSLEDIPKSATIFPAKWTWSKLSAENVNKWAGADSRMAAQFFFNRPETLVVSDFYSAVNAIMPWIASSSRYFGMSEDAIYAAIFQKYLKPAPHIVAMVDHFVTRHMLGRPWLAVHMRGSDKINESPRLGQTNARYFSFIDRIVELNPSIGVFILSDSLPLIVEFSKRYGDRLLCTQVSRSSDNTGVHLSGHDGVAIGEEVLIDVLLATKCNYFIGNQESNVSLAIASLRDWPPGFIFLLGEASIRGANPALHNRS